MLALNVCPHSTVMFRRERLQEKLQYDYLVPEDYDIWLRYLYEQYDGQEIIFEPVDGPVVQYRHHPNMASVYQIKHWNWIGDRQT